MSFSVDPAKCAQLNLREAPKPGAVIVSLPAGTKVEKIREHPSAADWWEVDAELNGQVVRGFLKATFLKQGGSGSVPMGTAGPIPPVHLARNGKKRRMSEGRAFPLDDTGMPGRPQATAANLVKIIRYLDPGNLAHKRYKPGGGQTFCNIYAHDYATLCGVFLPRVWWTDSALRVIANGGHPAVLYGNTVRELNANMLHDWFLEYGGGFGWSRVFTATKLQDNANAGGVSIIVAKRTNVARSGHILAVVPEHDGIRAARDSGQVTRPVQSQAGSSNFTAQVTSQRWWLGSQFQSFGFWLHA